MVNHSTRGLKDKHWIALRRQRLEIVSELNLTSKTKTGRANKQNNRKPYERTNRAYSRQDSLEFPGYRYVNKNDDAFSTFFFCFDDWSDGDNF